MKNVVLLFLLLPMICIAQTKPDAMTKLKNSKELLGLGLITQKEFDSIANDLKRIILGSTVEEEKNEFDGFYIGKKRVIPEKFAENKIDILGAALTGGIAGGGTKSILTGLNSKNILDVRNLKFFRILLKKILL